MANDGLSDLDVALLKAQVCNAVPHWVRSYQWQKISANWVLSTAVTTAESNAEKNFQSYYFQTSFVPLFFSVC